MGCRWYCQQLGSSPPPAQPVLQGLLTGSLPLPVQLVFAEGRDLEVDLFTLLYLFIYFFMNGHRWLLLKQSIYSGEKIVI